MHNNTYQLAVRTMHEKLHSLSILHESVHPAIKHNLLSNSPQRVVQICLDILPSRGVAVLLVFPEHAWDVFPQPESPSRMSTQCSEQAFPPLRAFRIGVHGRWLAPVIVLEGEVFATRSSADKLSHPNLCKFATGGWGSKFMEITHISKAFLCLALMHNQTEAPAFLFTAEQWSGDGGGVREYHFANVLAKAARLWQMHTKASAQGPAIPAKTIQEKLSVEAALSTSQSVEM